MTQDNPQAMLDQTDAALDGPITALTPASALAIIGHWQTACEDATGLDAVAAGLGDLRDLLSADALDGAAIATVMTALADATRAAQGSDERVAPRLERIAASLDRAAAFLGA